MKSVRIRKALKINWDLSDNGHYSLNIVPISNRIVAYHSEMSALEVQLQWKDLIHDKDQYMLKTCSSVCFINVFRKNSF